MDAKKRETTPDGKQERRCHKRIPISSILGIVVGDNTFDGKGKDLGAGGVLVVLSDGVDLKKGDVVVVIVSQRDTTERRVLLRIDARVAWTAQLDTVRTQAGLRFLKQPEDSVLKMLECADEAAVERENTAREEWEALHDLQRQFNPRDGMDAVCERVAESARMNRPRIGHTECHIWYYDPGTDMLIWKAGHGSDPRKTGQKPKPRPRFRIANERLRCILVEKKAPVLEADDVKDIEELPGEIWSAVSNWVFPLSCRNEFFGLLCFAFCKPTKELFERSRQFWFCHSLANYLAQAIERCESSDDNHLRSDLLRDLPTLIADAQLEPVYERIIRNMCELVGCESGVFRLYEPLQNFLTVCAKLNVGEIDRDALSYPAGGPGPGSCPRPQHGATNPDFCDGCEACRKIMPANTRALRITFWESRASGACVGQVCCFVGRDVVLEGRLTRRLRAVAESLSAVMETALHQVVRQRVRDILKEQRALASHKSNARTLLTALVKKIGEVMKAQACDLFLTGPEGKMLLLEASTCPSLAEDAYDRPYLVDDGNHLTSLVAGKKEALAIPNTNEWHRAHRVEAIIRVNAPESAYSFLGVPLFREGDRVGGVIRCSNKIGYPGGADKKAAFHRHDVELLKALADSSAPLILATTGERRMTERLSAAGHEVTAAAAIIQQKAGQVLEKVEKFRGKLERVPDIRENHLAPLTGIAYGAKGIKDVGAMVTIFQDDVSVSLSDEAVSWDPRTTNLYGDVIAQVVDMVRGKAREKGIEIDYDEMNTAPAALLLDPLRMKQLFYNLLTNAIKYNRRRSVTVYQLSESERILVQPRQILVRSRWSENRKSFSVVVVSDGRRIHEDEKDHIWEYGFRGRETRPLKAGLGIGMYIGKKIEKSAKGLTLELTRLYEPVVFSVRLSHPILP